MSDMIGVTERGDPVFDLSWKAWVQGGNAAILITKDPRKLLDHFSTVPTDRIIVHCTITGLGHSRYEPNVPSLDNSLDGYNRILDLLGRDRVVLRVDPVIPVPELFDYIYDVLSHERGRVRVSFLDNYPHVITRFIKEGICPLFYDFHAIQSVRTWCLKRIEEQVGHPVEVCGEPGFPSTPCVSETDAKLLGVESKFGNYHVRPGCECLGNKFELLKPEKTGPCPHGCLYCYWRDSK